MPLLISVLVVVLLLSLLYWAIHRVASVFGLPPQIVVLLDVLLVITAVVYVLSAFGLIPAKL